ncbi:hypothetical protein ACQ4WR_02795 [Janthinobacterium sp. RT4P48]
MDFIQIYVKCNASVFRCILFAPRPRQDAQRGADRHLVLGQIGGGSGRIEHFLEDNSDLYLLGRQIIVPRAVQGTDAGAGAVVRAGSLVYRFVILGAHSCLGHKEKKCLLLFALKITYFYAFVETFL